MMMGIAIGAIIVAKAGSAKSQEVEPSPIVVAVEVAAPIYAYGPQPAESPPNIRPRYERRYNDNAPVFRPDEYLRYRQPRYSDRTPFRGYRHGGQSYSGNGYREYRSNRQYRGWAGTGQAYARRPLDRDTPYYRYPSHRSTEQQDRYSARVITPQLRGQWRDLGPIYQLKVH